MLLITLSGVSCGSPCSTTVKSFMDADLDLLCVSHGIPAGKECPYSFRVELDGRRVYQGLYYVRRGETPNLKEYTLTEMSNLLLGHYILSDLRQYLPDHDTLDRDISTLREAA